MSVKSLLEQALAIFEERNVAYGNNYEHFGKILKALFPKPITLESESDWARMSNLMMIVSKLSRYARNFSVGGHEDSAIDSIVYWAIQQELDNVENGEYADRSVEEAQRACSCEGENSRKTYGPNITEGGYQGKGQAYIIDTSGGGCGSPSGITKAAEPKEDRGGKDRRQGATTWVASTSFTNPQQDDGVFRSGQRKRFFDRRKSKGTKADRAT